MARTLFGGGSPFSITASGTASATATKGSIVGVSFYATDISVSTNGGSGSQTTGGTLAVFTGSTGTTPLWQVSMGTGSTIAYDHAFMTALAGGVGQVLTISATGTISTFVNMAGFSLGQ